VLVNVTLPPEQKVVGPPADTVGVGSGLTVTAVGAEACEQPLASVTVTEYEPEEVTLIDWVVAPVLHIYALAKLEVRVTFPP
jgi:hypothetical protein